MSMTKEQETSEPTPEEWRLIEAMEEQEEVDRLYAVFGPEEDFSEPYGPYEPCTNDHCPCQED